MKFLLGIRTDRIDEQVIHLFAYYKAQNIPVVLCIDETESSGLPHYIPAVSINKKQLSELNLYQDYKKLLWANGDYALYAMQQQYPNYKGYWLIEDDAFIKANQLESILEKPLLGNVDFTAYKIRKVSKDDTTWRWNNAVRTILKTHHVQKCSFSIVYASSKLLTQALSLRQSLSLDFKNKVYETEYPSDEAFMMNFINQKHYHYKKLEDLYDLKMFKNFHFSGYGVIHYFDYCFQNIEDGFYHPIIIKNNVKDQLLREIKIYKKQKKSKLKLMVRYIKDLNSSIKHIF